MKAQITHGALPHSNDAVLPQICDSADTEFFLNNGIEHMLDVTAARPDADPAVLNLASLRLLTGLAPLASSNYMPKWVREPIVEDLRGQGLGYFDIESASIARYMRVTKVEPPEFEGAVPVLNCTVPVFCGESPVPTTTVCVRLAPVNDVVSEAFSVVRPGSIVFIPGFAGHAEVSKWQFTSALFCEGLQIVDDPVNAAAFVSPGSLPQFPHSTKVDRRIFQKFYVTVGTLSDEDCALVADAFLRGPTLDRFCEYPAAVITGNFGSHHTGRSGLLTHSLEVVDAASRSFGHPSASADEVSRVVLYSLLHDLGKTCSYTPAGRSVWVLRGPRELTHEILGVELIVRCRSFSPVRHGYLITALLRKHGLQVCDIAKAVHRADCQSAKADAERRQVGLRLEEHHV